MKTYVIHWEGPFGIEDFPSSHFGLYLAAGKQRYERVPTIQYCGISEKNIRRRITSPDHKIRYISKDLELWKGEIISDSPLSRVDLELTESLLVYFWGMALNEKKKINPPSHQCVVVNRWHFPGGRLRKKTKHVSQNLHDVIYWDGEYWHLSDRLSVYGNWEE